MRLFIIFICVIFSAKAAIAQNGNKTDTLAVKAAADTLYQCPMKCEGNKTYDKPGRCPVCSMFLKKMGQQTPAENNIAAKFFRCPMHPAVQTSFPADCPECGMHLDAVNDNPAAPDLKLSCPMHPEIRSSFAAKCPKCGMDLKTAAAGNETGGQGKTKLDRGHNESYTAFNNYAVPALQPTPPGANVPVSKLSNLESGVINQPAEASNAGCIFHPDLKAQKRCGMTCM